jgi:hypothetical protein
MAKAKQETAAEFVDKKSDVKGVGDEKFRKEFVVQALRQSVDELKDPDAGFHAANLAHILEQAKYRGLRPKGQPVLESSEIVHEAAVGNSVSIKFTYAVDCVPAAIDFDPDSTVTEVAHTEDEKRERARQAKLRAQGDPAGFDAA